MHGPFKVGIAGTAVAVTTVIALSGCGSSPVATTASQPVATSTAVDAGATVTATAQSSGQPVTDGTSSTSRSIAGPSEDMQWGAVQVTVTLKGKRIADIQATYPTERQRSAFINEQAVPMLRQEVLQAQVAGLNNIYAVSGATMTSQAYYQSLMAALQQAGL
jgi:uncharacterized protein with FMN-binding domain